jgi:putative PIN family toxin of toxin-antitoxin system
VRILLDTNILVSGLLSKTGPPYRLIEAYQAGQFELVTSVRQIEEFARVLEYAHLRRRITRLQSSALLETIDVNALMVRELPSVAYSPDPDDNVILAAAIAGGADVVVSGDKRHMLALGSVKGIRILTARDAVLWLDMPES